jgi:O-antigen ligase
MSSILADQAWTHFYIKIVQCRATASALHPNLAAIDGRIVRKSRMPKQKRLLLALVVVLFAVWPVPNSISLRTLLLDVAVVFAGYLAIRHGRKLDHGWWHGLRLPLQLLAALTLWIGIVALLISTEPRWSLNEIRSQWLNAIAAFALGGLAAFVLGSDQAQRTRLMFCLGAVLLVHIAAVDIDGLAHLFGDDPLYRATGVTDGPDKASYLTNMLLAFLFAEFQLRSEWRARVPAIPSWGLYCVAVLVLFGFYVEGTRNGLVAAGAMFLCCATIYFSEVWRRRGSVHQHRLTLILMALALVAFGLAAWAVSAKPGASWRQSVATIPVALDTDNHKAWLEPDKYPLPTLPDGSPADRSVYLRVAWFKEGLKLVAEHPLGVGYGRNAFGRALSRNYGVGGGGHSHSGYLDLAIGIGIPGVLFWLGFLVNLAAVAGRALRGERRGPALALLLLLVDFAVRMLLDSNWRDHMLQMFMFCVGLLVVFTATGATDPAR